MTTHFFRMAGTKPKECKVCRSSGKVNGEGKCEKCVAIEEEAVCPTCEVRVEDSQKGLQCDDCQRWYHASCEGVEQASYSKMQEEVDGVWFCRKCMRVLKRQVETVKRLREERDALVAEQRKFDVKVKELMECLGAVERKNRDLAEELKALKQQGKVAGEPAAAARLPADHTYSGQKDKVGGEDPAQQVKGAGGGASPGKDGQSEPAAAAATASASTGGAPQAEGGTRVEGEAGPRSGSGQASSRKGAEKVRQREQEARGEERAATWMGVGKHSWDRIMAGKKPSVQVDKPGRRVWLFGDSLMRGVGREVYCLSKGQYRVIDKSVPGSNIRQIHQTVQAHLSELQPEDLVVVEGGGNGLEEIGAEETLRVMKDTVAMIRGKIMRNPLVMCVPMRRGLESGRFGQMRRWVNGRCVERLEDWRCDGLQLWERLNWRQVWAQDGIHLSNVGKVWTAWNVVEWAQHREDGRRA